MVDLLTFDAMSRKKDDCPLNHSRCFWSNNGKIIETYQKKQHDDLMKCVEKDNKIKEKEFNRLAAIENARGREGDVDVEGNNAPPILIKQPKRYKCSNSSCVNTGAADDRSRWTGCRIRTCTLLFCLDCATASTQHKDICNKV